VGVPVMATNVKFTAKNAPIFQFALISRVFDIFNPFKRIFYEVSREKMILLMYMHDVTTVRVLNFCFLKAACFIQITCPWKYDFIERYNQVLFLTNMFKGK